MKCFHLAYADEAIGRQAVANMLAPHFKGHLPTANQLADAMRKIIEIHQDDV